MEGTGLGSNEGVSNGLGMADYSLEQLSKLVADRMRAERVRRNLTQEAMAEAAGISLRTYRRLEATGKGSIENLLSILKAMGRTAVVAMLFPTAQLPESVLHAKPRLRASSLRKGVPAMPK